MKERVDGIGRKPELVDEYVKFRPSHEDDCSMPIATNADCDGKLPIVTV
jgi:hypothetical protein